ncbi:MAG TPA: class I SAM-dependent methyltransferase [Gaiellaceae bacterium]|nr:class I SAM-dependent methyltransferase [Gaiellaceae bacterium]
MAETDVWAEWLRNRRTGGSPEERRKLLELLAPVRDKLLDDAEVGPGDTVLDVGCGDGLVGLGALERGADVIFSDISNACLDDCRAIAGDRARYRVAPATDLGAVEADVVTMRSVLIYVDDKQRAFDEFFRVLRPGGRLSIFEPINRFGMEERCQTFGFADVDGIEELLGRIWRDEEEAGVNDAMVNFGARDLFDHAERAGFGEVRLELHAETKPEPMWQTRDWDVFVNSSPNPLLPTLAETMAAKFTRDEIERVTAKLRPQVEQGLGSTRFAKAYLLARKC